MTTHLLPGPADDDQPSGSRQESQRQERAHDHNQQRRTQRTSPRIASEEDCLAALSQIPAALVAGLLTPAKANSMRAAYASVLQHYAQRKRGSEERGGVAHDELAEMLREHPEYANLLEPFLSDEQIATILGQAEDSDHETP